MIDLSVRSPIPRNWTWSLPVPPPLFWAYIDALDVPRQDHERAVQIVTEAKRANKCLFFIGNGGSAAIASHMAADWLKNGDMRAMCFNDPALMSCLANDLGYARAFSRPLSVMSNPGDVLFAISSSGESKSITRAANLANECGLHVITLSGFKPDNPLRKMGDVNFHIASDRYGVVEVAHHVICHSILDTVMA